MKKICCFGEFLLRMSPALQRKWITEAQMPVYIGGAELNVAHALACWQQPVKYVSALPENSLSTEIIEQLKEEGIDVSGILHSGDRIGIYFLPQGTDLKHAGVIYDRAHSSFAGLRPGMLDWDAILKDVNWFHFSAISPALNENLALVCREALEAAASRAIPISVDLNYRARLWQYGKRPTAIMPELVANCDVIMGNIWSANSLLGIALDEKMLQPHSKRAYLQHAAATAGRIMEHYPKCTTVAQTFRFDEDGGIRYYAALNDQTRQFVSPEFYSRTIVDKVGSGDCFMAGLIFGLHQGWEPQQVIDFSAAAAFGKLSEKGDATRRTTDQVYGLLEKEGKRG